MNQNLVNTFFPAKNSRRIRRKESSSVKEKDQRIKSLGQKIGTKFMSVVWNELVPTPMNKLMQPPPSHFQREGNNI